MVQKQIEEDKVRQLTIMNLAVEFENASIAKGDMRKAYEECNDIPEEKRALIDIYLKEESDKDYEMYNALFKKAKKDGENIDKMKEKGDACIFVGYSAQSKAYKVFNKRTRIIVETIHVNFDELPQMASDHVSSDPGPQCSTMVLEQDSLSPGPQSQENVPQVAETVTTSNELELLYSPMFSELLNGTSSVVSKSSASTHALIIPINFNNITKLQFLQQPMLLIPPP
ncbi:hypothetical protein Tco_1362443 [Tanacetum coccineum]